MLGLDCLRQLLCQRTNWMGYRIGVISHRMLSAEISIQPKCEMLSYSHCLILIFSSTMSSVSCTISPRYTSRIYIIHSITYRYNSITLFPLLYPLSTMKNQKWKNFNQSLNSKVLETKVQSNPRLRNLKKRVKFHDKNEQ